MLRYTDQTLNCRDCPSTFVFTAAEQERFAKTTTEDGSPLSPPKRCAECRQKKRERNNQQGAGSADTGTQPGQVGSTRLRVTRPTAMPGHRLLSSSIAVGLGTALRPANKECPRVFRRATGAKQLLTGVRRSKESEELMPTRKGVRASATTGKIRTKTADKIDTSEHDLVITFRGVRVVESGPYKGTKSVDRTEVYVKGKKLAMVSRIEFVHGAGEPLPHVQFTFSTLDPQLVKANPAIKELYERNVEPVKSVLPWAFYTSPVGNREPGQALNVLDLGMVKPAAPEPTKEKKRRKR